MAIRGVVALLAVLVIITLVTSFTASSNVPASNVGTFKRSLQIADIAPGPCISLSLSTLVTGSGTFSSNASNALILGSAGSDSITAGGSGNCIVAGGGTNTITGTSTDVCVTGPTLNVGAPCATTPPTTTTTTTTVPPTTTTTTTRANGVTVTTGSDNYNNYGGQERLYIANVSAITSLSIVIKVAHTTGISFNSQYTSYPTGYITESSLTTATAITYTYVLNAGDVITPGYPNAVIYAQYTGAGAAHAISGDSWTVRSTAAGVTSLLTGTF